MKPALAIQLAKVVLLSVLLVAFLALTKAESPRARSTGAWNGVRIAQAPPAPEPAPPPVKEKKKKKKAKKTEPTVTNALTDETGRKLHHFRFEVPPGLQTAVNFWITVYSKYGRAQEVFHDTENLGIVYSVLDFSDLYRMPSLAPDTVRAIRRSRIAEEKARIKGLLLSCHEAVIAKRKFTPEEKAIADKFADDPYPDKFKEAANDERLRSQTGIRENFIAGIRNSGAYMEEIEDIFASYGLPMELTRLVFVESMFNTRARSKVGASGIWQFMPATGRLYLNIDAVCDERNDPIQASHAAARLLKSNYEALGTWPLAINAYNSGRATMSRAVSTMGTEDIATIIAGYRGGVYGFASRNFFPSFLAALEVANRYPDHLGKVDRLPPEQYENYYLKYPQRLGELAEYAQIPFDRISDLNPHLQESVLNETRKIPAGYSLRIPKGFQEKCAQAEDQLSRTADGRDR